MCALPQPLSSPEPEVRVLVVQNGFGVIQCVLSGVGVWESLKDEYRSRYLALGYRVTGETPLDIVFEKGLERRYYTVSEWPVCNSVREL